MALVIFAGCRKDEGNPFISFALDTENSTVEGSFVQGAELLPLCHAVIPYVNAEGGEAVFSAEEVNGVWIERQTIALEGRDGIAKVEVKGTPRALGMMYLPVSVEYMGGKYQTTVSMVVFEDTDPNGNIDFKINANPIVSMTEPVKIPFTVSPTMSAVTVSDLNGIRADVEQDLSTGVGTITLTPNEELLSGTLTISASFGVRPVVSKELEVNAFRDGNGTEASPYKIINSAGLNKLRYGLDKAFTIANDITVESNWSPVGTLDAPFVGTLDGGNHKVTYSIKAVGTDVQGFFGYVGAGAKVKNIVFAGDVWGRNYVSGVAAHSDAPIENCNAENVNVKGNDYLAVSLASGTAKDARVMVMGKNFPTLINIPQGVTSASESLDVTPLDIAVNVTANPTNAKISYDAANGMLKADISGGNFKSGEITVELKLAASGAGSKVVTTTRNILIDSKKMNEGGDGTAAAPYIVADADQLATMMANASSSYIALKNDIALTSNWTPIASFSGNLDGKGFTVTGLKMTVAEAGSGFVKTLAAGGSIHDIKFANVTVETAQSFGTVAGINNGTIENVEVTGTINSTHTGDLLGGIVGDNLATAVVNNCYVNLNMTATCGMVGGIVGRNKGTGTGTKVTNCSSEGSITVNAGKTRISGIVGRGEGPDLIKGCSSAMNIVATTAGANGVGGIFGANNNNNMKIEECVFTGSVKSNNDVGGIAGVGVNVKNCLVENATISNLLGGTNGNAAGVCGTNKMYCNNCIVRGSSISGVVGTGKPIAGIAGHF